MQTSSVVAEAGSAAALSVIFGNPLIAAVLVLEVLGLEMLASTRPTVPAADHVV